MQNFQKLRILNPSAIVTPNNYNSLLTALALGKSNAIGLRAKSGGQASALRLFSDINTINTVLAPGHGVKLPDVVQGMSVTVQNSGANMMYVFPYETDRINNSAPNVPFTLMPGDVYQFNSIDSTSWSTISLRGPQGAPVPATLSVYDLDIALSFAILTGGTTTVSNGQLIIPTGDIGETTLINPGNISFLSGSDIGPSTASVTVVDDLYDTLSVLTEDYTFGATNFEEVDAGYGVKTFLPGVYRGTSYITTAATQTITLIGDGDYVFISDATINFGADTIIELKNGAQASRIFWIAEGAITTGANNVLKGNFISPAAINIGSTNDIEGRIISTLADITIDGTATRIYI